MTTIHPDQPPENWIDDLTDEQCMEIFWLYVDPPEPFLAAHPPALLGQAMRLALKRVAEFVAASGEDHVSDSS
jgi:hypothetical protein